jgi:hypothetical protein
MHAACVHVADDDHDACKRGSKGGAVTESYTASNDQHHIKIESLNVLIAALISNTCMRQQHCSRPDRASSVCICCPLKLIELSSGMMIQLNMMNYRLVMTQQAPGASRHAEANCHLLCTADSSGKGGGRYIQSLSWHKQACFYADVVDER